MSTIESNAQVLDRHALAVRAFTSDVTGLILRKDTPEKVRQVLYRMPFALVALSSALAEAAALQELADDLRQPKS